MFIFMPSFNFFVRSWSKYIVCFLLRSEDELMAVKETHKEPERLTDKVSAFDIYSCFLNFTLFISMSNSDFWHWSVFF